MTTLPDPVVIVGIARTAMGGFQGDLKEVPAPHLGATAIRGALERAGVAADQVDEVVMGMVLSAGVGQAPARQASRGAGLPDAASCTTLNKMCGSGMKAAMVAHDMLVAGTADVMIAGGMENMTRAPHLLEKARAGYRMGHAQVYDHMLLDGLEDAYDKGRLMGTYAEDTAEHYRFTRDAQDAFAVASLERARKATEGGIAAREIVPVTYKTRLGTASVDTDQPPRQARADKIPTLQPAFREGGTVTAANSSSISDGAAALVMMRRSEANKRGLTPLATIRGHTTEARAPRWFTTAPVGAIEKLLDRTGWTARDIDLWEINEAFAVVPMAAMTELDLPHDTVNVHGGACALGHPIGASGARIMVTLITALREYGLKRGIASLCIGGGEATAIALEMHDP